MARLPGDQHRWPMAGNASGTSRAASPGDRAAGPGRGRSPSRRSPSWNRAVVVPTSTPAATGRAHADRDALEVGVGRNEPVAVAHADVALAGDAAGEGHLAGGDGPHRLASIRARTRAHGCRHRRARRATGTHRDRRVDRRPVGGPGAVLGATNSARPTSRESSMSALGVRGQTAGAEPETGRRARRVSRGVAAGRSAAA